jgi:hypothetical protein
MIFWLPFEAHRTGAAADAVAAGGKVSPVSRRFTSIMEANRFAAPAPNAYLSKMEANPP